MFYNSSILPKVLRNYVKTAYFCQKPSKRSHDELFSFIFLRFLNIFYGFFLAFMQFILLFDQRFYYDLIEIKLLITNILITECDLL